MDGERAGDEGRRGLRASLLFLIGIVTIVDLIVPIGGNLRGRNGRNIKRLEL